MRLGRSGVARYAIVMACLALVLIGSARPTAWRWQMPTWRWPSWTVTSLPSLAPPPAESSAPAAPQVDGSGGILGWVILSLLGLGVLIVVVWFLRRLVIGLLRTRIGRTPEPDHLTSSWLSGDAAAIAAVTDAVEVALARLDAAETPKDAVIAAWLALEETAGRHGIVRSTAQTPTEFVLELLQRSAAPPAAVELLRTLYHRARFSAGPTTPQARSAARTALVDIAHRLEAEES